jgi:hypothetical protein
MPPAVADGVTHDTTEAALALEVAVTAVGAPGVPTLIALDAYEDGPVPAALSAVTVNV